MGRYLAVLAVLVALGACVPMHWTRPGIGLAEAAEDMSACRRAAAEQAWREERLALAFGWPFRRPPVWTGSPHALSTFGAWRGSAFDRWRRESELEGFCMRVKGYRLEPADAAAGSPKVQ
jgi:hypothetical protein